MVHSRFDRIFRRATLSQKLPRFEMAMSGTRSGAVVNEEAELVRIVALAAFAQQTSRAKYLHVL
jgi:hypothetical protein